MNLADISTFRLHNQKILQPEFRNADEIVAWMGAMQAQDFIMAEWAVGTRLFNPVAGDFEDSFNKAAIIRTHLMRPTWHFVAASDVYWLLKLTAPRIRSSLRSRQNYLEITEAVVRKVNRLLTKELDKEGALTRDEVGALFEHAGIRTDENRFSHLMLCAELEGIVCSGAMKKGKQTYDLLQKRVPDVRMLTYEESLAELAKRYFTSHGPATEKDFAWWSGLSAADIRNAIESIRTTLDSETIGTHRYWCKDISSFPVSKKPSVFMLPAYDEFLIGYTERSPSLSMVDNNRPVSINGIFRPVLVINGQVAGIWRRVKERDKVVVEFSFFRPFKNSITGLLEQAVKRYGNFLGIVSELRINY